MRANISHQNFCLEFLRVQAIKINKIKNSRQINCVCVLIKLIITYYHKTKQPCYLSFKNCIYLIRIYCIERF